MLGHVPPRSFSTEAGAGLGSPSMFKVMRSDGEPIVGGQRRPVGLVWGVFSQASYECK